MSPNHIGAPSRKLDEFEQRIYNATQRVGTQDHGSQWDFDAKDCNLRFESATRGPPAEVSYLFTVTEKLCNMLSNLHGGCAATLVDNLSSMILIGLGKPGMFSVGGVSRNLALTYLRPVPLGAEVRLVSRVVHMGRRLALVRTEIIRVDTGHVCIVSDHEKVNTDPEVGGKL